MRFGLKFRQPGPLLAAIGIVGAGVGLAAMVFGLADPVLRSLPYADPDRLVSIGFGMPNPRIRQDPAVVPSFASWQARTDLFQGVAAFLDKGWLRVRLSDRILPLRSVAVTGNLLEVLGLKSRFDESDPAAALVSNRVASRLSGGELQPGQSARIIPEGVLRISSVIPDSFLLPKANRTEPVDVLVLLQAGPVIQIDGMASQELSLVARLHPGVTPEVVEAALNVTMAPSGRRVSVAPLSSVLNSRLRGLAIGALLASGLVVFVCWANVFSMALTRGLYRATEIATRTALGATPTRIVLLLGAEGLRAAAFGSASALAVTWFALNAALRVLPPQFATLGRPSFDGRLVLFVVFAAGVAGISWWVATVLAWKLATRHQTLQAVSRDGRAIRIVRFVLIAGQLAAASVLLVGSALLGRSYLNLMSVDTGLDEATQTLTVAHDPNVPVALKAEIISRTMLALRSVSGVTAVGASGGNLLDGRPNLHLLIIDGRTQVIDGRPALAEWTHITGDYFTAVGLRFLAAAPRSAGNRGSAVLTEGLVRQYFAGRPPIGAILSDSKDVQVVGVVPDVRSRSLSLRPAPAVYVQDDALIGAYIQTTYVLRVSGDSAPVSSWERVVRAVDPLAVVLDSGDIRGRLDRSIRDRTFATVVIGLFAVSSLVVATLGLAGVVAYTVGKRTREIAVRLALGATVQGVRRHIVREATAAAVCGVLIGVTAAVWLSRVLESLVYGIRTTDPTTLLFTAAGLIGVVTTTAMVSAVRISQISPAIALRME